MEPVDDFYDALPRHATFEALSDPQAFTPLPQDWMVGLADIVGSSAAIEQGRYKAVNMVGAAVISAQINGFGERAFPYVFGGDGAVFACAPQKAEAAAKALADVARWSEEQFGLGLRVAMIPVADIRAQGRDVSVARFQASDHVDYAMFSGGGVSWAEARMKAGEITLPPAPAGAAPNLTGLSCRWSPVKARNGVIASLVIEPKGAAPGAEFAALSEQIIAIAGRLERDGHPIPPEGAGVAFPPPGLELETRLSRLEKPMWQRWILMRWETLLAWVFFKTDIRLGTFKPSAYRAEVGSNADFRKFEDGLKMTLDVDTETVEALRRVLDEGVAAGIVDYGLFQQEEAMMTCIVPSVMQKDHVHFVDGASGGYASAAAQIKGARAL